MGANTGAQGPPDELEPVDRFEWERMIRMLAIPRETKGIALLLSTYADRDGTNVHPGEPLLARVTGLSDRSVRRHLSKLRETYFLIERVSRGWYGGRGGDKTDCYRLVVPSDLTDRVTIVSPTGQPRRAQPPKGQQEKLPLAPVDNPQKTGHPRPVDNPKDRTPISGLTLKRPDTGDQKTGHPLQKDRTLNDKRPDTGDRPPIKTPLQDQNTDHPSRPDLPSYRADDPPVDNDPVDNSAPSRAAADWNTVIGKVRDRMAAANTANPRHARPNPDPIVRPDRE